MEWLITLIVVGCFALVLVRPARKPAARKSRTTTPTKTTAAAPNAPITTHKAACDYLHVLLASRSAGTRRTTAADMREEMREHVDELRTSVEYLTERIAEQLAFRQGVAEGLDDDAADGDAEPDDEATARTRRHLGHLDREIADMKTQLAADKQAIRDFRADRTAWVQAYAQYCLNSAPNPNLGRTRHTI